MKREINEVRSKERKRICVIGNGERPSKQVIEKALSEIDLIIAADGGSRICKELNITPDIVTGDFDSLPAGIRGFFPETEFLEAIDQERSDMEKAVELALSFKPVLLNMIAASGKRTDHLLANILLISKLSEGIYGTDLEIKLFDNQGILTVMKPGRHLILNRRGKTVSFFSLGTIENLTLSGFRYNLQQKNYQSNFTGLSNIYEEEECIVEFSQGRLFRYDVCHK